jgi:pyochelin synthetase
MGADPAERQSRAPVDMEPMTLADQIVADSQAAGELLLQDLFAEQAALRPGQPAVVSSARTLSYGELARQANRLARYLRQLGVKPNRLVAVVMEKGWQQPLAVMGIVQAGAAYLPIDPDLPSERLRYILENGEVEVVLTQSWLEERFAWPDRIKRLRVDSSELEGISDAPLERVQTADDLAYVIYTSGSTGQPKGVMIAHRGVVNSVLATNQQFRIGPDDRAIAVTALHHDMSVYDIFGILAAGGTLVMPDAEGRKDPAHWSELMRQYGVTIWNSVPAMMEMMLEHAGGRGGLIPASLRWAFLGGDWISVTLPERLGRLVNGVKVVSVGGPTETTLWNIWYVVEAVNPRWKSIPYGRPIARTRYYVMNEALEECPAMVSGEMCCAGVGVAKGYWRDREKTEAKFVRHPRTGERIYRTGDMGRLLADGNLEFLGRIDQQVKINGQRIELEEIEAVLQQHPKVRAAVVVASGELQGSRHLVAYLVPASGDAVISSQVWSEYLAAKLPEYMVPKQFVMLDRLPLTANGKVDRRALPERTGVRPELTTQFVEPRTELERSLTRIWQEILQLDRVGAADNFFDLGAQSLHIVQAHRRLQTESKLNLKIVAFFQYPTISSLCSHLSSMGNQPDSFSRVQSQAERQKEALARQKQLAKGRMNV